MAFKGMREFNQSFSTKAGFGASDGNQAQPNIFSEKIGLRSMQKLQVFNSI
jgi:hypothetical protein